MEGIVSAKGKWKVFGSFNRSMTTCQQNNIGGNPQPNLSTTPGLKSKEYYPRNTFLESNYEKRALMRGKVLWARMHTDMDKDIGTGTGTNMIQQHKQF